MLSRKGKVKHSLVMFDIATAYHCEVWRWQSFDRFRNGIVKQLRATCSDGEVERGQTKQYDAKAKICQVPQWQSVVVYFQATVLCCGEQRRQCEERYRNGNVKHGKV